MGQVRPPSIRGVDRVHPCRHRLCRLCGSGRGRRRDVLSHVARLRRIPRRQRALRPRGSHRRRLLPIPLDKGHSPHYHVRQERAAPHLDRLGRRRHRRGYGVAMRRHRRARRRDRPHLQRRLARISQRLPLRRQRRPRRGAVRPARRDHRRAQPLADGLRRAKLREVRQVPLPLCRRHQQHRHRYRPRRGDALAPPRRTRVQDVLPQLQYHLAAVVADDAGQVHQVDRLRRRLLLRFARGGTRPTRRLCRREYLIQMRRPRRQIDVALRLQRVRPVAAQLAPHRGRQGHRALRRADGGLCRLRVLLRHRRISRQSRAVVVRHILARRRRNGQGTGAPLAHRL